MFSIYRLLYLIKTPSFSNKLVTNYFANLFTIFLIAS
nr:MAG TPA: hypothetical protein [Caudoviricetes sp.]